MIEEWYEPQKITFSHNQVLWIIRHLPMLREGQWPTNPQGTNYTTIPGGKKRVAKAYFEVPCQIGGEVDARLLECGLDGLMVEAIYCWNTSPQRLAKAANLPITEIGNRINRCLKYISGWEREQIKYKDF